MKWPWSKTEEKIPEIHLEPRVGDWQDYHRCHCGYLQHETSCMGGPLVPLCPRCGHRDKWVSVVAREEWEALPGHWAAFQRHNIHIVLWTPEHCPVNEVNP